jgi:anti-anti-sigma regulatory factor
MENVKISVLKNKKGKLTSLTLGGVLAIENSQQIQKELVSMIEVMASSVEITIQEVEDIDLSFIQLLVAFQKKLSENKTKFMINWNLDEDQHLLFKNVALSNELFMND